MSSAPTVVENGRVVTFHYTLKDDEGSTLDSSAGGEPLMILHGAENIVPGLEKALVGRAVSDSFEVSVAPEDGYGLPEGPGPKALPRDAFPDGEEVVPGMQFMVDDGEGEQFVLFVVEVGDDAVMVDRNHPLAGRTLHFAVTVTGIREATDDERDHGHPHGPHGHHHH